MSSILKGVDPAVEAALKRFGIEYQVFHCDPDFADTALFCSKYNYLPEQSANAIIVASRSEPVKYCCCVVLANTKLDVNKKVSKLLGVKKVSFASAEQTMQLTAMQIGGVTPFGLPAMPVYIDSAVMSGSREVVLGGGNRASKVILQPSQLLKIPHVEIVENLAYLKDNAGPDL